MPERLPTRHTKMTGRSRSIVSASAVRRSSSTCRVPATRPASRSDCSRTSMTVQPSSRRRRSTSAASSWWSDSANVLTGQRLQSAYRRTELTMDVELGELKQRQRQMWATGDFPSVARRLDVGEDVVDAAEIERGMEILDVAAGSGNAAIRAAREGAKVIASDLTPELFDAGRRNAADAGVELDWVEADAEHLPFEDACFDRVLSTFGAMFAPRHDRTASELSRVTKPGGR